MADITIYKPADVNVIIVNGDPPVDQTALVAQLQAEVASLTTTNAALQAKIDAAKVPAQATVDALA